MDEDAFQVKRVSVWLAVVAERCVLLALERRGEEQAGESQTYTGRIDDFPLLLEVMQRLGLPAIIDNHLRRHGLQQGLSWGWIATIWLAHILTQSNPVKQPVQSWVRQAHETIERITGMKVNEFGLHG